MGDEEGELLGCAASPSLYLHEDPSRSLPQRRKAVVQMLDHRADLRRQVAPRRGEGGDSGGRGDVVLEQGHESAGPDVGVNEPRRKQANTQAAAREAERGFGVARAESALHSCAMLAVSVGEGPRASKRSRVQQALVCREVCRGGGGAVFADVSGRGHETTWRPRQGSGSQRGVVGWPDAQREVEALLDQADVGIREGEVERDVAVTLGELGHQRDDVEATEHLRHAHADAPSELRLVKAKALHGGVVGRQGFERMPVKSLPGFGDAHGPRRSCDKLRAELFLERPEPLAHRRLFDLQLVRDRREASAFNETGEGAQRGDAIHMGSLLRHMHSDTE